MSGPIGTEGMPLFASAATYRLATEALAKGLHGPSEVVTQLRAPSIAGSATSDAAARAAETTGKAARDRARILVYLRSRPDGATEAEIATATGLSGDCVRPRVRELGDGFGTGPHATRGMGLIRRTERTRRIPGHRLSLIWEAV